MQKFMKHGKNGIMKNKNELDDFYQNCGKDFGLVLLIIGFLVLLFSRI
jgi:hypothetical protein